MTSTILNAQRVEAIFFDCLFKSGEDTSNRILAEGVAQTIAFNPERVEKHRTEIEALLDELPDDFKSSVGGGWSFLNACLDRHGDQWTGLHQRVEQLVQLGIAIGKVQYAFPRNLWTILPGGMPYLVIS